MSSDVSLPAAMVDRMARALYVERNGASLEAEEMWDRPGDEHIDREAWRDRAANQLADVLGDLTEREEWQGKGHPQLYYDGQPDEWMSCNTEATAREFDVRRHRTTYSMSFSTPWVEVTPEGAKS